MHSTMIFSIASGYYRSLWRSQVLRACILMLILLAVALDSTFGASIFTLLCLVATALLPIYLVIQLQRDKQLHEQIWTSKLDTATHLSGILLAYLGAAITMLCLCWLVAFPFSAGQGGGTRLLDGTVYHMSTRGSLNMLIKAGLSTLTIISLILMVQRWTWLMWSIALFYWFYAFALGGMLGSYANVYGLEHGIFPPLYQIIGFPPFATYSLFAASWLPWALPCLGWILFCGALTIWNQHRSVVGTTLCLKSCILLAVGVCGLGLFIVGEYMFINFLEFTYKGYF